MKNILAINEGTIPFAVDLESKIRYSSEAGFDAIGIWYVSIDKFLKEGNTLQQLKEILTKYDLEVVEVNYLKRWLYSEGKEKKLSLKYAEKLVLLAKQLNAYCITAAAFGNDGNVKTAINNFRDICQVANQYGIKVALEFLPWQKIASIKCAWKIVNTVNMDNGGLLVDIFHFYKGSSQLTDFDLIPPEKIFLIHVNDYSFSRNHYDIVTQTRNYRLFPGEGNFNLVGFFRKLADKGYKGPFSLEVFNKEFVQLQPKQITLRGFTSLKKVIN